MHACDRNYFEINMIGALGLLVANVSEAMSAIERVGGGVIRVDLGAHPPSAVVEDPDGHTIELVQE